MTDFGADDSFAKAVKKLKEHYGIEVPQSAIRHSTQHHAQAMLEEQVLESRLPQRGAAVVIAETDGCFVRVVKVDEAQTCEDKRKTRKVEFKEARLSLARKDVEVGKHYNATMRGVEQTGAQLLDCVIAAGAGKNSRIHCLGDGASWIERQVKQQLGEKASYLPDFYHVSEYLASASEAIVGKQKKSEWLCQQQKLLKENRVSEVLEELRPYRESQELEEGQAPVRACERYIENRLQYLDYKSAIEAGLPIGSGEVESGHRTVIQARLTISGASWKEDNAEKMLRLRVVRANGEWQSYWDKLRQAAA